ncbi:MAG: 3-deoxy-manno-octulosonate-8-phosphatase KdsC [Chromatiaceae bacterium]|nr:3-deoxy-manno-octulosonate-8-phosphatase KdsC [Gammaproteobacteria bacterium]MCP5427392.1 3-deoxy-manno-octulosonate-8-phosphatase KdsC [Chromatiaceae bacterium]MCB1860453.1 3-deoxy-manno-octulosonate-8-phosphatase KdsC [Gammaproteobacteria bacterium]MCB1871199.1 3-deoxy-manno-octulosonate-8-phosphatase KdsC [Gammaproteobacteria bacterium]MCB1879664.1 3-deoxy-manno-octulosonate-8-phosphatase KdsC [Gammaproteobacteria bacterium]
MKEIIERAARIKLVVFDVDGVLTDGSLFLGDDGQEYKAFYSKDGLGMKMLQRSGVKIGIITARSSRVVALRMESLGIQHIYQGQEDKLPAFEDLQHKLGLKREQIAYVGDDVVDLPIMRRAGLSIAVQDAHKLAIENAHWTTTAPGGRGAAREVCELLLEAQGRLATALERYL